MIKLKNIKIAIIFAICTLVAVSFSLLLIPAVTQTQQASTPANAAEVNKYGFQEDSEGNYLIYSRSDLDLMTEYYNLNLTMPGTNKHKDNNMDYVKFKLMKDLEIDETFHGIATGVNWYGPTMENAAYGTFDGNFHTITWDAVYGEDDNENNTIGLFAVAGYGLSIKNLKLVANVRYESGQYNTDIGALIGYAEYGDVLIENCYVDFELEIANYYSKLEGFSYFGGFIGYFKPDRTDSWSNKIRYKLTIVNSYYGGNTNIWSEVSQEVGEVEHRLIYNGLFTTIDTYKSFKPEIINSFFKYKYCIEWKYYGGNIYNFPDKYYSTGEIDGILQPDLSYYDSSTATSNFTRAMTNDDLVWYVDMEDLSAIQKGFVPYWKLTSIKPNENGEGSFFTNVYLPDINADTNNSNNEFSDEDVENDIIKFQYAIYRNNSTKSYISLKDLHYIDYTFKNLNILPKQGCKYEGYTCENVISNESDNHIYKGNKIITINFEREIFTTKIHPNYPVDASGVGQVEKVIEYDITEDINLYDVRHTFSDISGKYKLLGFNTNKNATKPISEIHKKPGEVLAEEYYCIWGLVDNTKREIVVYQNYEGADPEYESKIFDVNEEVNLLTEFALEREGYSLLGFATSPTSNHWMTTITLSKEAVRYVLYAIWAEGDNGLGEDEVHPTVTHNIKVYRNTNSSDNTSSQKTVEELKDVDLLQLFNYDDITLTGYLFLGYSTRKDDKALLYGIQIIKDVKRDYIIYAQWEEFNFYIKAYQNYNSSDTNYVEITYGTAQTVNLMDDFPFVREGYKLIGFRIGSRTSGDIVKQLAIRSERNEIYAQWEEIKPQTFSITVYRNYSADDTESETITYKDQDDSFALSSKATLDDLDRSAENYSFVGFATTADGKAESVVIEKGTTGNKEYFCIWEEIEPIEYELTFKTPTIPENLYIYNIMYVDGVSYKDDYIIKVSSKSLITAVLIENTSGVFLSYIISDIEVKIEYKLTVATYYNKYSIKSEFESLLVSEDTTIQPSLVIRELELTFVFPEQNVGNLSVSLNEVSAKYADGYQTKLLENLTSNYTCTVKSGRSLYPIGGNRQYEGNGWYNLDIEMLNNEEETHDEGNKIVRYKLDLGWMVDKLIIDETINDNPCVLGERRIITPKSQNWSNQLYIYNSAYIYVTFKKAPPPVEPIRVNLTFKYNIDHAEMYITDLTQSEPAEVLQTADYTITLDLGVEITTETDIANNRYSYIIGDIKITYVVTEKKYWLKKYNLPGEDWFTSRNEPTCEVNQLHGTDLTIVPIITLKSYDVEIA